VTQLSTANALDVHKRALAELERLSKKFPPGNEEIFRGRYLGGFDKPAPLRAGSVYEYKYSLHDVDHVFKAGHTVLVEVQSTWFPLYDRNPQTFVPNIMTAKPANYKPATITIFSDAEHDSTLQVPLINACDQIDCF
jgi:hypothetical protein